MTTTSPATAPALTPALAPATGGVVGWPRTWLRLEGLAALVAGIAAYRDLGGDWLWVIPGLLAVDLSMLGYVAGPQAGAITYNLAHNWFSALLVLGAGLALNVPALALAGCLLVAHIGIDRLSGFGLKYPSAFGDTHLGWIGRSRPT
ncbi:MAG TPA: DUF4260 domain-containing protein [Candidatus Limnocylindrales bacterium]|nr:DUF4260 domain-containing protein [Candidatus Limnocylindrales bacterium]